MGHNLFREYIFKFYLNASHFIIINGKEGETHPHTWEFSCEIVFEKSGFIEFNTIEDSIQQYFDRYQNKILNEFEPFDRITPTLENISEYFIGDISNIVENEGGRLIRMESSETPTRSYVLSYTNDDKFISDLHMKKKLSEMRIADKITEGILGNPEKNG